MLCIFCGALSMLELDPALGKAGLGTMAVKTPLQALFSVFLLKAGTVKSMTAARNLAQAIVEGDPKEGPVELRRRLPESKQTRQHEPGWCLRRFRRCGLRAAVSHQRILRCLIDP
uniref:Uncharacterized protein n=1 Tax=Globodera rostochiensis TaxID=31243 RepID=A0A914HML5_GLORO